MIARDALRRAAALFAFAVAMGFLEAAVVVYLRELYYPWGFSLPLVPISTRMTAMEIAREAATIVMLAAVAVLAAREALDRFYVFGFLFGVWDLVYYAGLWAVLRWPRSPRTWDVLFLIPVPWVAPVAAPMLISLLLIAGFVVHEAARSRGRRIAPTGRGWAVAIAGAALILVSFVWRFRDALATESPRPFPWFVFLAGLAAGVGPFLIAGLRWLRGEGR